jgi:hypothetical protein
MYRWLLQVAAVFTVLCIGVNAQCYAQCTASPCTSATKPNPAPVENSCHHKSKPGQKQEKSTCVHDQFPTANLQKSVGTAAFAADFQPLAIYDSVVASLQLPEARWARQSNSPPPLPVTRSSISILRV